MREAEALEIWRPLGMVSALDYLERVLGYAPRTAQDRLRVARALGDLPQLTAALAADQLSYSAVRELTRVATPATEAAWIAAAQGKNLRQLEELVADRKPGDRPDDPPDPAARTHVVRFELSSETFARLRQARQVIDDEHPTNLGDDAFIAALCNAALDDAPAAEPSGRARFAIAMTVCERCRQGWQEGAGARLAVDAAAVDRALCDAQHIGSLDGAQPERAHQDVPPSIVRFVWRRDGGRCRVDGCRSARGLEIHHLVHRANGGGHDPSNLILTCSACHQAHHAGTLRIRGTADCLQIQRPAADAAHRATTQATLEVIEATAADHRSGRAHVGASSSPRVTPPRTVAGPVDIAASTLDTAILRSRAKKAEATTDEDLSGRAHVGASGSPRATPPRSVSRPVDVAASKPDTAILRSQTREAEATMDDDRSGGAHVGVPGSPRATPPRSVSRPIDVAASTLDAAILRSQTKEALTALGWKPAIASAAVAAAAATIEPQATLEHWIVAALRQCPAPRA